MNAPHQKLSDLLRKSGLGMLDTLVPFIATAVLILIVVAGNIIFFHKDLMSLALSFDFVWIGLFAMLLMAVIGFAGMKALVHISAGLSLIIFLAQSYCAVPVRAPIGNTALKFLLVIGLVYLLFDFFQIFYKGISGYFGKIASFKRQYFWKFLLGAFFLCVIALFLSTIYEVMSPIVLNLCIYR